MSENEGKTAVGLCVRLKTKDFKIVTCSCYYSNWKGIKDSDDETWKFDEIELGKPSFRKLFHQKMTIFHYCYSCFEKCVMMNTLVLSSDALSGFCLVAKNRDQNKCEDICSTCIWFFISQFKNDIYFI